MSSQAERSPPPERWRFKRSESVALVLVAGAGAAAWGLARIDPSQREEDVLVYAGPDACVAAGMRTEMDCRGQYATARLAYPDAAPRYESATACEAHHGAGHCVPGGSVSPTATGRFVPVMAGYVIGRTAEQDLDPQPVYDHNPAGAASHGGHGGGYCTGWGGRVATGGGSVARVASAAVRPASFGGFGATGRGFAARGAASHGG